MPTLNVSQNAQTSIQDLFGNLLDDVGGLEPSGVPTTTSFSLASATIAVDFSGSDFAYDLTLFGPLISDGTINSMSVTDLENGGAEVFNISGLTLGGTEFQAIVIAELFETNTSAFESYFFGLDWVVNGTDFADQLLKTDETSDGVAYNFTGDDVINLGGGNDKYFLGDGADIGKGGKGKDTLWGGTGKDTLNGGNGADKLYGEKGMDTLKGGAGVDKLWGGKGNDALTGGSGGDTLNGGKGNDVMTGGNGADTFDFGSGTFGNDTITDFDLDFDVLTGASVTPNNVESVTSAEVGILVEYTNGSTIAFLSLTEFEFIGEFLA